MKQPLMRQHEFLVLVDDPGADGDRRGVCKVIAGASAIDLKRGLDSLSAQGSEADWLTTSLYFCG
jgi:hypothetical protein